MRKIFLVIVLFGCAGGPAPPDWQLNAAGSLENFQNHYLSGDAKLAEQEFALAKSEIARTGRGDLLARAELVRCAVRAASLEFDACPGFEALRADAGPEEITYADVLAGKREHAAGEDPLSGLVSFGVQFRTGKITPAGINAAIDVSSAQGWRRPLLAWLGVQAKRAESAGDAQAAARIKRRIDLILRAEVERAR